MNLYNIFYTSVYFLNKILRICGILFQKQQNTKIHTSLKCVKIQVYRPTLRLTGQNQTAPHSQNTPQYEKRPADKRLTCEFVEPTAGLEPATYALRMRCSTN